MEPNHRFGFLTPTEGGGLMVKLDFCRLVVDSSPFTIITRVLVFGATCNRVSLTLFPGVC